MGEDRRLGHDAARCGVTAWTKNSRLPSAPRIGEVDPAADVAAELAEARLDLVPDALVDRRVADHAAPTAHLAPSGLELRLDEQHHRTPRLTQLDELGGDHGERDERQICHHPVDRPTDLFDARLAEVLPLDHGHSLVGTQAFVELAVADIEGDDAGGAALQHAVGEPARRCAGVEHRHPRDVDGEGLQRGVELLAAAADEPLPRAGEAHRITRCDLMGRFGGDRAVDQYATGLDRCGRLRPAGDELTADELGVEPPAAGQRSGTAGGPRRRAAGGGLLRRRLLRRGLLRGGLLRRRAWRRSSSPSTSSPSVFLAVVFFAAVFFAGALLAVDLAERVADEARFRGHDCRAIDAIFSAKSSNRSSSSSNRSESAFTCLANSVCTALMISRGGLPTPADERLDRRLRLLPPQLAGLDQRLHDGFGLSTRGLGRLETGVERLLDR